MKKTRYDKPMFFLPTDLTQIVIDYVWSCKQLSVRELRHDLIFYIQWRQKIPGIFLSTSILDRHTWMQIPNPMIENLPYYPSKFLSLHATNVWSENLFLLGTMLCKEKIRECRTYKRCAMRWIDECVSFVSFEGWNILYEKLLSKLQLKHFRSRAHFPFVLECLHAISS